MTFFPGISVVYAHEGYTYRDLLFFIYVSCMYSELYRFHVLMTFCHFVPFFPPSPPPPPPDIPPAMVCDKVHHVSSLSSLQSQSRLFHQD